MWKRWLPTGSVLTAAVALLLLMPETSSAQWRRSGVGFNAGRFGFSYGAGRAYYGGYYPGYSSGYSRWNAPYYGSPGYPRYYGSSRWSSPGYMRGWYEPGYSSSYPSGMTASSYPSQTSAQSYYGPTDEMPRADQTVRISVRVPPDAELWFDGVKTQQTGRSRDFISPPLEPGQDYVYHLRARWMRDGQEGVQTRELRVRAGDQKRVDFLSPGQDTTGFPSSDPVRGAGPDTTGQSPNRAPVPPDPNLDRTPGTTPATPGPDTPRPGTTGGTPTSPPDKP